MRVAPFIFALLVAASPAFGWGGIASPRDVCPVVWNLYPMVGTPHATQVVAVAIPSAAATLRAVIGSGSYAYTRTGLGEAYTKGAGGFSRRAGTWASMRHDWAATGSGGQAALANQAIEFLFVGLSSDAEYQIEVQCELPSGKWARASQGLLHARTLPAAGANVPVRVASMTDGHTDHGYINMVATDVGDIEIDQDSDGVPDYKEKVLQHLQATRVLASWVNKNQVHFVDDLGDEAHVHIAHLSGICGATPVGPCSAEDWAETDLTGQLRELGYGPVGYYHLGLAGHYDDEVDWAEARLDLFFNLTHRVTSRAAYILHPGNHEGHAIFGESTRVQKTYYINDPSAGATDGGQMGHSVRQAMRNVMHNANDPGNDPGGGAVGLFYPAGCDGAITGDFSVDQCQDGEEDTDYQDQGFYYAIHTGDVLFIYLDEYIHTEGVDTEGAIFAEGETFLDANCVGGSNPLGPCLGGSGNGINATNPSTPHEWDLGEAQRTWFRNVMRNATATTVVIKIHHQPGGSNGGNQAYGRGGAMTASEHYCVDAQGEQIAGPIECWDSSTMTDKWCDWSDDQIDNDSAHCLPVTVAEMSNPLLGQSQELYDEAVLKKARMPDSLTVFQYGHDHIMALANKPLSGVDYSYWMWEVGAFTGPGGGVQDWPLQEWMEAMYDYNGNGIADYQRAPEIRDNLYNGHGGELDTDADGWDGNGFAYAIYYPGGCADLMFVSTAAFNMPAEDGKIVWKKHICGSD